MNAVLTARIEKRERSINAFTAHTNWQGGVSYEWVAWLFRDGVDNGRKITRTRKELLVFCAELGYEVTKWNAPKVTFTNVDRGPWIYSATIEVNGRYAGYVQKGRSDESYKAFSGGRMAGRARTLAELRAELVEVFTDEPLEDEVTS